MIVYRHKFGFSDNTDYIELRDDNLLWASSKDGIQKQIPHLSISACEEFVALGHWTREEIKEEQPSQELKTQKKNRYQIIMED